MNKQLKGRFYDDLGRVIMTVDGLSEFIVKEKSIDGLLAEDCDDTQKYNKYSKNKLVLY